jgi:hypothetical protein
MKKSLPVTFLMFCLAISVRGSFQAESRQWAKRQSSVRLLEGVWKSEAAENAGNGNYSTREFKFTEKWWRVEAIFYNDQHLRIPLFSFMAEGPYLLGDASSAVTRATNAVFSFSKKSVTLLSSDPAVISRFKLADCNLVIGVPKDISFTGCSFITSISQCAQEYDLVEIKDDLLRLGIRPPDRNMCTEDKRPKALGLPVRREKEINDGRQPD